MKIGTILLTVPNAKYMAFMVIKGLCQTPKFSLKQFQRICNPEGHGDNFFGFDSNSEERDPSVLLANFSFA